MGGGKGKERLVDVRVPEMAVREGTGVVRSALEVEGTVEVEAEKGFWD